ncbi:hypothetical protein ACH52_2885 [Eubacterium limosum]|mgnify:CR=1 FL=1|nr:hypothetical protein ACH52_2885 [Eubacterium limosum]
MKKKLLAALVLLSVCCLSLLGCSAEEDKGEEIPLSERSIEEQVQNNRSTIFKEYDNIKAFRAVYQNDLRTMNGLVDPKKYDIVLKNLEYENLQTATKNTSKVKATYKKIDKDKYVLKYYDSFEAYGALKESDLAALNESVRDQGATYKPTIAELVPEQENIRAYYEKVDGEI